MRTLLAVFFMGLAHLDLTQARIGMFWHVTDFHLDTNYTTGGDTSSMCWNNTRLNQGTSTNKAGPYGDYLCDAPITLVRSAIQAMKDKYPKPDFIMWTGDDTAHVDDKYFTTDTVVDIIRNVTEELKAKFPETTFLPVLGNHDYYPKSQLPPGVSDLQTKVADLWKPWLNKLGGDAYNTFKSSGRYFVKLEGTNVYVMALNTLIWYKSNDATAHNQTAEDPDGQFEWAHQQLTSLNGKGGKPKAYLMGHIPPGSFERYQQKTEGFHWYQERYNKKFIQLIKNHSNVIEAQFFAHHHTDSFRLFFKDDNRTNDAKPISYQLLAPGVTPWKSSLSEETGANNPGVRLVSYDNETTQLTEVSTYYLDLADANVNKPDWKLEYNFMAYYKLQELSASSLFNLTNRMKNDTSLFGKYYEANTVKYEDASACTTDKCRTLHWCSITEIDYSRFHQCNSASGLIPWTATLLLAVFQVIWMLRD